MKSIVYIKKSENDYEILIDYFLRRSIYFQKQLSKLGITRAGYLINFGGEFQYTHFDKHTNDQDTILILDNTIPVSELEEIEKYLEIKNIKVLGCVVENYYYGDKTILHDTISSQAFSPNWYNKIRNSISKFSIPGYTCFDIESIEKAFALLGKEYPRESIRLKLGNGNNGIDHYVVNDRNDLFLAMKVINTYKQLDTSGVSVELNLENTITYGVTRLSLNGEVINTLGKQTFIDGVYVGSEIIEERGEFENQAIQICNEAYKILEPFGQQLNRFNVDIITGTTKNNKRLTGIIDLSLRVGSATYIELEKLINNKATGVYHIYSRKKITKATTELLKKTLENTKIEIIVKSKYVFTLKYPTNESSFLESEEFKAIENKIKEINYYKNPLFRR